MPGETVRGSLTVHGRVQKVGYRDRVRNAAVARELTGWVRNDPVHPDQVHLEAQGPREALEEFVREITGPGAAFRDARRIERGRELPRVTGESDFLLDIADPLWEMVDRMNEGLFRLAEISGAVHGVDRNLDRTTEVLGQKIDNATQVLGDQIDRRSERLEERLHALGDRVDRAQGSLGPSFETPHRPD